MNTLSICQTWIKFLLWITPKFDHWRRTRLMLRQYHFP
jgi:hypothetical protein